MPYLALAALIGWLLYSWKIAAMLCLVCGVISLFYAGAVTGPAQDNVIKTFSAIVLGLSLVMLGIITTTPTSPDEDSPKLCNRAEC